LFAFLDTGFSAAQTAQRYDFFPRFTQPAPFSRLSSDFRSVVYLPDFRPH